MSIEDQIKKSRPSLKQTSIDAYIAVLTKMRRDLDKTGEIKDYSVLKDFDKVKNYIDKSALTTKKNKLTAIIVYLKSEEKSDDAVIKKYTDLLAELNGKYTKFIETNEKTETQKANWIEYEDLEKFADKLVKRVKVEDLRKKADLNKADFDLLQTLVIVKTYIEYPLRNDFADMKVIQKSELKESDEHTNYLVLSDKLTSKKLSMEFVLNEYKNRERLGKRTYDVPKNLLTLYKVWLNFNKSGYFLVSSKNRDKPLNPSGLTKYMNKIFKKEFNKKISTSMIRHITISHLKKNDPTIQEIKKKEAELEDKFLHSGKINDMYRKI